MLKILPIFMVFIAFFGAGTFVVQEIVQSKITGTLGLSTCAYGLIFYIAIFIVSFSALRNAKTS